MFKVNGAWYVDSLPNHIVVEMEDGRLFKFYLTPFREISLDELQSAEGIYNGYHPRKCKGQPLPDYLYRFYGLQRNEEIMDAYVKVRLYPSEKEKFESYIQNLEPRTNTSDFLREYIRGLVRND